MRTVILVVAGQVLAGLLLRLVPATHRTLAASTFTVVWLGVAALNLRTGLSHGYTLAEELPIHLVLFGVPTVAAWGIWRWLRR